MAVNNIYLTAGIRDNLFSLQKTESQMGITQNRLATGLKVNSALDDPINFFAAQDHRQRAGDLSVLKDAMNEAIQTIKTADTGIEAIMDLIEQAKSVINAAKTATDATEYEAQYDGIIAQMSELSVDSFYKGVNLLNGDDLDIVINEAADELTVAGIDPFDETLAATGYGLNVADFTVDAENWDDLITDLEGLQDDLKAASSSFSSNLSIVTTRLDFTQNMINTLNTGADNLTLADMNEESANMLMLQTRQALATASLGMASDSAQAILRLF